MKNNTDLKDKSTLRRIFPLISVLVFLIAIVTGYQMAFAGESTVVATAADTVVLQNENAAPIIDLNGPDSGVDHRAKFTEDQEPVLAVSPSLIISDTDSATLQSAVIKITNPLDSADEAISLNTDGTGLNAVYQPDTGVLQLRPTGTVADYEQVLRTLSYVNYSQSPATADRLITFQLFDGNKYSNEATSTVLIEATNDAPTLKSDSDFRFADIQEDDTDQVGNRVASFIDPAETGGEDRITDPDQESLEGIAVIGAENDNGGWEFSTDAGVTWNAFGILSNSAATLLDPAARIRFLPDLNYHGAANITIRAWDQTSGSSGDTAVDTSENGGTSAFSIETAPVNLQVIPVNDSPIIDLNGPDRDTDLVGYHLLGSGPAPLVAPSGAVQDIDNDALVFATATLSPRPDGASEVLAAGETSAGLIIVPYDPATGQLKITGSAPLADYTAILRTLTYSNTAASPNMEDRVITFIGNDGLEDGPVASTTLHLLATNNAPALDNSIPLSLPDVSEDDDDPPGGTVYELFDSAPGEPISDDEGSLRGLAITGADNEDGQWQYSLDDGESWRSITDVSNSSALLLNEMAKLRFLPSTDAAGFTRNLVVRAWDQTSGFNGSEGVDVSNHGGSTAFSVETSTISVNVASVNDSPQLALADGIVAEFIEDNGPVIVAGPSLRITDVDNDFLAAAEVAIVNHMSSDADILAASPNGSGIVPTFDSASGILYLEGTASVSAYQAALRSVTFENRSHDPATHDRKISFLVYDDLTASNSVSSTVSVESVNDLPVVDLNGNDSPGNNVSVTYGQEDWGKNPITVANQLELQDLDDSTLMSATVTLLNKLDGDSEFLEVSTAGTNIEAEYEAASGNLELTGIDSIVNYERVLRTITYTNNKERPLTKDRRIRFVASDQQERGEPAISRIIVIPKLVMMPLITFTSNTHEQDEPNDSCDEAYPLQLNVPYQFQAEDKDDWYSFSTTTAGDFTVSLTEFEAVDGQILVAAGTCDNLTRVAHNGDYAMNKILHLERLAPDEYYIWVITDNLASGAEPYEYNLAVEGPIN